MSEYHKIDSVYLRDPANKHKTFLIGQYANPAFAFLENTRWVFTEKVDGTNIRVIISPAVNEGFDDGGKAIIRSTITFGGKTDDAQIPAKLVERLSARFNTDERRMQLSQMFPEGAVLYGEGYGAKIQKVGGLYRPDQDFVLFDVKVGDWWLERSNVEDIAAKLNCDIVPIIGTGTLPEMVTRTMEGFKSIWGDFTAEGIVARPATELKDRAGKRIITKVKYKDFIR